MPELPEVETFARYFTKHALHQRIARVEVRDERILGDIRKEAFVRALRGRSFSRVRRHGKHLFADAKGVWLHLHFGMSGDLHYSRDGAEPRWPRVVFTFDDKAKLSFDDMRIFGLADVVEDPDAFIEASGLGPDPLDPKFRAPKFLALLEKRRGAIKSLLMSQEIIAGLGNLYVDEILYQSSVAPRRPVDRLDAKEARAFFTNMRRILREAIARHARESELPPRYLFHHREAGERCPMCGGTIQRATVFGRTTYFCARHQK
ncbi:MAG TPA: DNA-formamidopyrimidine glycosylase family protein [Thermoanaerobaculia bacterium]|nr:DNA-formamidopyrimidine glycosylase family protein [Thermoanaerobaculia bacterium]